MPLETIAVVLFVLTAFGVFMAALATAERKTRKKPAPRH